MKGQMKEGVKKLVAEYGLLIHGAIMKKTIEQAIKMTEQLLWLV